METNLGQSCRVHMADMFKVSAPRVSDPSEDTTFSFHRRILGGTGVDGPPPKREMEGGTELLISPIFCKHKHVDSFFYCFNRLTII